MDESSNVDETPKERGRLGQAIVCIALGTLAFAATVQLLPAEYADVAFVTPKIEHLIEAEPYDVVFVGSSLVYRNIAPAYFDREMVRNEREIRSFNLGIPAMRAIEAMAMLERLLSDPRTRPSWVLFEASYFFQRIAPANALKARSVYWHDLDSTLYSIRSFGLPHDDPHGPFRHAALHLGAMAYRALNVGTHASRLKRTIGAGDPLARAELDRGGFVPLRVQRGDLASDLMNRRRAFMAEAESFAQQVQARQDAVPTGAQRDSAAYAFELEMLARVASLSRRYGTKIIFFISPVVEKRDVLAASIRGRDLAPLFDFSRPRAYPLLFEIEDRFDATHLNRDGAHRFSRVLAREFAYHLDALEGRPRRDEFEPGEIEPGEIETDVLEADEFETDEFEAPAP